jgi:hypothetical protein
MSRRGEAVAAMAATILLWGCDFLPGTAAYQEARAREAVAQTLIDPASAQFRNVESRSDAVCGEVNGKNRMGAYVGFVRFYVETADWRAMLDPQFDPQDLYSARRLCSSLTSYDSASCARQTEEEAKEASQLAFDRFWLAHCTQHGPPGARLPFDPTRANPEFGNESEPSAEANALDSPVPADSEAWYAPADDAPLVDQDGNPIGGEGNSAGRNASRNPDSIDQNWLDRAIDRPSNQAGRDY